MKLTDYLRSVEYPGRGVLIGLQGDKVVLGYFVTARSGSSKAKKYVLSDDQKTISVQTTNLKLMARGKLDLLHYTSARFSDQTAVIGNGRQTEAVELAGESAANERLATALGGWSYEDDAYRTPRITGCWTRSNGVSSAALHIIRSNEIGTVLRSTFEVPLIAGQVQLITTYRGENVRPTPAFQGAPIVLDLEDGTVQGFTKTIYEALAPQPGKDDLRVAVMGVMINQVTGEREIEIINASQD